VHIIRLKDRGIIANGYSFGRVVGEIAAAASWVTDLVLGLGAARAKGTSSRICWCRPTPRRAVFDLLRAAANYHFRGMFMTVFTTQWSEGVGQTAADAEVHAEAFAFKVGDQISSR
jgi:hypothetical protein